MYQRLLLSKSDDATICSSPHPTRPVFWKDLSTALTREYSHANGMLDNNAFPGYRHDSCPISPLSTAFEETDQTLGTPQAY